MPMKEGSQTSHNSENRAQKKAELPAYIWNIENPGMSYVIFLGAQFIQLCVC